MKVLLLMLFTVSVFSSSCKKDENQSSEDIHNQYIQLLSAKPWKPALVDKNPSTNPTKNLLLYYAVKNCELDDVYTFNSNGFSLLKNEGSLSCEEKAGVKGFNYSADFSKQKIVIDAEEYQLAELSETQLKLYRTVSAVSGVTNMVYLYEH